MNADWNSMSDEAFRTRVREEFEGHYPAHLRHPSRRLLWAEQRDWWLRMSAMGWIAPNWPVDHGGMGLSPAKLLIFLDEQERWGIGRYQDHGVRMVGPALMRFGTPEQLERFLPPIRECRHRYCQGYSEPEAGSDLASLRTTARLDGADWVVSGQKIWTTMAHDATHIFLLARTAPAQARQAGLSFFLLDMATPGVTVRTIRDMSGADELCEVFFDEVRIPATNLVGGVGAGWTVANSVLGFERIHIGSPALPRSGLNRLARVLEANGLSEDAAYRDRYAALALDVEHLADAYAGFAATMGRGEALGPEVSLLKLVATETFQAIADVIVDAAGAAGGAAGPLAQGDEEIDVLGSYYRARPSTIYGGSSEIQRNILARRVLRLPAG